MPAAAALIEAARALDALGFMPSKSGNLSLRTARGYLITPAALPYAETTESDLVELDLAGEVLAGHRRPSSEWRLHAAIYAARPEAGAVVHTHSPFATALSCARQGLPPFHYMIALGGGGDIRCSGYATFGTEELRCGLHRRAGGAEGGLAGESRGRRLRQHACRRPHPGDGGREPRPAISCARAAGLEPVLLDVAELAAVFAQSAATGGSAEALAPIQDRHVAHCHTVAPKHRLTVARRHGGC
ncbi:class II aldolase/adducin family protein [Dankookia sp. P2]|uniref:class II aldolase/adducin family protein n=1 Tax=Dankookia sp. P2 TaxID=3423955 RepID=UPI003D670186